MTDHSALIGSSGFVGGNLLEQRPFSALYNSKNIEEIAGQEFGLVICAGAPAAKWIANREPEADLANIKRLMAALAKAKIRDLVLISTVDVYRAPIGVNEESPVELSGLHPYGANRYLLERFCSDNFNTTILRLPGLFGSGLKKNVIFDLLNSNNLSAIDCRASFQYYSLSNISRDIERSLEHNLRLLNVATEPISVREVASRGFGIEFTNELSSVPASYDFRSIHAGLWGGSDGYLYSKEVVFDQLRDFLARLAR